MEYSEFKRQITNILNEEETTEDFETAQQRIQEVFGALEEEDDEYFS